MHGAIARKTPASTELYIVCEGTCYRIPQSSFGLQDRSNRLYNVFFRIDTHVLDPKPSWTHNSALALSSKQDPVEAIRTLARRVVFHASEAGWTGPPFDPFQLAEILNIRVIAQQNVVDARIISASDGKFQIEFNPNRPKHRVNYSICHEIAHTFFPDCAERVRNRVTHEEASGGEWELEMLCNVGAAELLMPVGSFPELAEVDLTVDALLELRGRYGVSTEAVLLRTIHLTPDDSLGFAASFRSGTRGGHYVIDYAAASRSWRWNRAWAGTVLPKSSIANTCTAIGYTAKATEDWPHQLTNVRVECVGLPPYPGQVMPRVVGFVSPSAAGRAPANLITYLKGDATSPHGASGPKIIAQIVSDSALTWGAGFALAARRKWPAAQQQFRRWALERRNLKLGNVCLTNIDGGESLLISMVVQHGYGPSTAPRIRYAALDKCLQTVRDIARADQRSIHMPRIGVGQAGGRWTIVSEMIDDLLCRSGVQVYVYDLPNIGTKSPTQRQMFDEISSGGA
jgi:O-acetyl-ADP-ribose deacetylase (regulator of RNase III)